MLSYVKSLAVATVARRVCLLNAGRQGQGVCRSATRIYSIPLRAQHLDHTVFCFVQLLGHAERATGKHRRKCERFERVFFTPPTRYYCCKVFPFVTSVQIKTGVGSASFVVNATTLTTGRTSQLTFLSETSTPRNSPVQNWQVKGLEAKLQDERNRARESKKAAAEELARKASAHEKESATLGEAVSRAVEGETDSPRATFLLCRVRTVSFLPPNWGLTSPPVLVATSLAQRMTCLQPWGLPVPPSWLQRCSCSRQLAYSLGLAFASLPSRQYATLYPQL